MRKEVARAIDDAVARGETPCAMALLWRRDEERLFYAGGHADMGRNVPVDRDTIFRLYSLTKPMTAVTAMTLVERGELDLMAPVSDFLEGFQNQQVMEPNGKTVPAARPVQVRDLFSMTSGLCYPGEASPAERAMTKLFDAVAKEEQAGEQPDTVSLANRIGRQPLAHQPGERWLYGTSADILGAVVQIVAGKPLDQFMAEALFEPLGMEDTAFWVPEERQPRFATLYEHRNGMLAPYQNTFLGLGSYLARPNFLSGGAGLTSTLDDVLRFARMLLGQGELCGERVLSPRSVAWLSHNHLSARQLSLLDWDSLYGHGYGGLMRVLMEPAQASSMGVAGEYGWDGWAGSYMTVCPAEDMVLLLMQHRTESGMTPLTRKIRNIVYAHLS